jgi:hypothetical protein
MNRVAAVTASTIRRGQVIDVGGVATHVWAADDARAEAMASMLRAALPRSDLPSLAVRFEGGSAPGTSASRGRPYEVRRDGPQSVFVSSDRGLTARVTRDRIVVRGEASDLAAAFRPVFSYALAHALEWRERHVLHAATLAVDDGCVLVLGPTGSGKSTIAWCALRCGHAVLGDDLAVLVADGDRIAASAVPRPIAVPPDVGHDPRAFPIAGDARGRHELPADAITSGTRVVRGVLVAVHGEAPTSALTALRSTAVPPIVLASCLVADDAESRRARFPLATALSRVPAFELAHGTRAATRVDDGAAVLRALPFLGEGSL